jgi:uncharacterized membrane protein
MFLIFETIEGASTTTLIIEAVKTFNFFLFDYVWDKIKKKRGNNNGK